MGNVLDKGCGENQIKYFMLKNFSENRAVYAIM
jgi:hypothetical protein